MILTLYQHFIKINRQLYGRNQYIQNSSEIHLLPKMYGSHYIKCSMNTSCPANQSKDCGVVDIVPSTRDATNDVRETHINQQ